MTLDASASYDPDGGALSYFWEFGDGSTAQTDQALVQHTYADVVGELRVGLRVRDGSGQENGAERSVILYNAWGTFPCQTTVTCLQMASCQQAD
ncbi:PKD domain-containing protein, partial [Arthrospira platensis SPKY1]|nr:PKD domain-containing protein [Arthrospira platensis SPKY1]